VSTVLLCPSLLSCSQIRFETNSSRLRREVSRSCLWLVNRYMLGLAHTGTVEGNGRRRERLR
jgi:hypothetical protein